jgi:hypothetical protein
MWKEGRDVEQSTHAHATLYAHAARRTRTAFIAKPGR